MSNNKLADAQHAQPQSGEWVMVPRKITPEMEDAADRRDDEEPPSDWGKMRNASRQAIWSAMLAAAPQQEAEPVGFVTAGALLALQTCRNDEYNGTVDLWMRPNESVKANIPLYTHPQPAQDAKDAARYRWLRDSADSYTWAYLGGIGADRVDAAVDAAMAKESGR